MVLGEPIFVGDDADADALERARTTVEAGLDAVHARAYELVGGRDRGAREHRSAGSTTGARAQNGSAA
jgi:hypothetical protein